MQAPVVVEVLTRPTTTLHVLRLPASQNGHLIDLTDLILLPAQEL